MGYLQERHGMTMLGRVPEGTCEMCATVHDPGMHTINRVCHINTIFTMKMVGGPLGKMQWFTVSLRFRRRGLMR